MSTFAILRWLREACPNRKHSELNLDGSTGDDQNPHASGIVIVNTAPARGAFIRYVFSKAFVCRPSRNKTSHLD
ncbi:MAG TPA: hypothetical protein VGO08_22160 [Burkholderiales bacterium]|jgi:hypothetical protein|nr:hypothetical protein [Burkholderiales bacterium]